MAGDHPDGLEQAAVIEGASGVEGVLKPPTAGIRVIGFERAEVRQLGRTMRRWRTQIAAWHQAQVSNGPTETMNALAKRIKRIASA